MDSQIAAAGAETAQLLSEPYAARILALSVSTLRRARRNGNGPRVVHTSQRRVANRIVDLKEWAESRVRG